MFLIARPIVPSGCMCRVVVNVMILLGLTSCAPMTPVTSTSVIPVTSTPVMSIIDVGDGGFLSGDPCGPPCFWGITPGETTEAEAIEILQERGAYGTCETWDRESEGGGRGINCGSRAFISFGQGDDVVDGVGFNPSGITVQEIVAKYGEPDGIEVGALGMHGMTDYQLIMAYPSMLTLIRLFIQEEGPYVLEPSTSVENITYAVVFGELPYADPSYWREWRGYGEY